MLRPRRLPLRRTIVGTVAAIAACAVSVSAAPHPYATASYALKDVGAPPTSSYSYFGSPLAFNKTGQIVGQASPAKSPASQYQHCIAYTGSAWVDFESATSLTCTASSGISDANSSGVFKAVGQTYVPTVSSAVAFYATISPKSASIVTFPANSTSALYAMNGAGLAAGYTYYSPFNGFSTSQPPVTSTGAALTLLEPYCTAYTVPNCTQAPYSYNGSNNGSRSINASGTILAPAIRTGSGDYFEYTGGSKPKAVQFSLPLDGNNGAFNVRGIDDRGSVAYAEYDSKASKYYSWTYNPTTRAARNLGTLPNNTCTEYLPLYVNGPGRVFGQTVNCSFSGDQTYWTWDATNGMVAVSFPHGGYQSVSLYLINDAGQLVGDFSTTSGSHHWGILTPPTKL